MRKAGIILCVLILTGGFAAAWVVLSPEFATPRANELAGTNHNGTELQPLDSPDAGMKANEASAGETPIEGGRERDADKSSERENIETDESRSESNPPLDTKRADQESPRNSTETDLPEPSDESAAESETEPTRPDPEPFIRGHKRPAGQNLGNVRPRSRRVSQPAGVKKLDDVTPKLRQDRRGLYAQYFGLNSADLTKLDKSDPDMVRIDRQVYFPDRDAFSDLPIALDNFAAEWTGYLVIDEPGDYWLFWGADNGGRVELDGETVLLQDGMVRYVEVSTVLTLETGLHPLKIEFAQTKNNVADWAKCAAALMWVPEGESKPIPIPPEMLMVPEWMWSDNAPIITKLSKTEGEIGDEITIHGQGLGAFEFDDGTGDVGTKPIVRFAGRPAEILDIASDRIKVRVPIGTASGDIIVYAPFKLAGFALPGQFRWIPSNSVEFTVTTRFGLLAEWHDFSGWENFGFEALVEKEPDVVRVDSPAGWEEAPNGFQPSGVVWTGRLGVPLLEPSEEIRGPARHKRRISYQSYYDSDVTVGVETQHVRWGAEDQKTKCTFEFDHPGEFYVELRLVQIIEGRRSPVWWIVLDLPTKVDAESGEILEWEGVLLLHDQYYFPPKAQPVAPEIDSIGFYGEQPAGPGFAYEFDETGEPISVGGGFSLTWKSHADFDWDVDRADVLIDGIAVETESDPAEAAAPWVATREIGVIPESAREGVAVVRITRADGTVLESEPYYFNLATQGLATYLYDVPEGSGLSELPDLGPLNCFKVRKDKQINFESAADFDLPFPAETFVIEWLGGLVIEEEGDYEFICRSDDGMMLWLDDNVIVDANHRQAPAENKATVHLVPGTYRFRMQFFENNQHEVCVLEWRATRGEGEMLEELIPRQVIPARAFSLDVHPPFPAKTSTGKKTDGS